ncbi:MAG TPA: hypothetical protein VNX70_02370 [Bryobacteraceae bacterium]|jgi:hypothetical protein|nr:hypothetical protein [Bryobacteraceae bacterium]
MELEGFLRRFSWSVTYSGYAYDDARCAEDGIWYYRDILTHVVLRFANQAGVVPLSKNPT